MTSDNKKKIKAERPRGFEDLSGEELLLQEKIISAIEKTYKFYGFEKLVNCKLVLPYQDCI